jgi:hypothetical protein
MSSDQGRADRDDPGRGRLKIVRAADAFDRRDHVMTDAAYQLHVTATASSAAQGHPGFVPGEYLAGLTGQDPHGPGADPAILAAELCTVGLWRRAGSGYRILDWPAVQLSIDHVRELRAVDRRAPARRRQHDARRYRAVHGFRAGEEGEVTVTGMTRFGQRVGNAAAASFRCAACGEMAGVVKVARAGTAVDMGPPLGRETYDRDAIVVDYFLGTASRFADAATLDAVHEVVSGDAPDPAGLRRIDWELAPFYCPDCDLNYCRADWNTVPVFDEGFYDRTLGTCPSGHRHTVAD